MSFLLTSAKTPNFYSDSRLRLNEDVFIDISFYAEEMSPVIPIWTNRFSDEYCDEVIIEHAELRLFLAEIKLLMELGINESATTMLNEMYNFVSLASDNGHSVGIYGD